MKRCLTTQALSVQLRGKPVLKNVHVQIEEARWTAIVGPNGAGKSTLARCLAGLLKPSSGQVLLHGRDVASYPSASRAKIISWLGQSQLPQFDSSVRDLILLGRLPWQNWLGQTTAADLAALQRVLAELQIIELEAEQTHAISGGELQRTLIARSLVGEAEIFIQDEPLANLDIKHQRRWVELMRTKVTQGKTVITVLHELDAALLADHIILMDKGHVIHQGAVNSEQTLSSMRQLFDGDLRLG